jgi:hypothetical protein
MIGAVGKRGPKPMGAAAHIARGTYRRDRHGPKPDTVSPEEQAKRDVWAALRLPGISPARPLDPIEEVLKREGIEITPEDRKPRR